MLSILLPAAGNSSRMKGADKLLEDVDGRPCLAHMARRALQASDSVIVTLPSLDHPRAHALEGLNVTILPVPDAAEGMAASLRIGAQNVPDKATAMMVLPADMPDITGGDLAQMWAVFQAARVRILQAATDSGEAGHPVIFARPILSEFSALSGDKGAQSLIARHAKSHALLPLEGNRARMDLDTPQAWAEWRKARA